MRNLRINVKNDFMTKVLQQNYAQNMKSIFLYALQFLTQVGYYIKWVKTYWTYSMTDPTGCDTLDKNHLNAWIRFRPLSGY